MRKQLLASATLLLSLLCQGQVPDGNSVPFNPFGNPLIPDMAGDPSIIVHDGTFYCYVTTDGYGQGLETSGPPVVWKSRDFVNWSFEETYFPQAEHEKYWAPSQPVQYKGKWYTYPTVNGFMYPAVADSPDGPFRLVKGDTFTPENRLYWKDGEVAIDAEAMVDDDGQRYVVWGERNFARLGEDMVTLTDHIHVPTHTTMYTEGPIFFKRKGVYYYLYTFMALERYCYYYEMSRVSPLGPYIIPEQDLVCETDAEAGVFGPGHGCVFNVPGTDDYYLAYLEFGRNSTNRQIYVNKLEFNDDGTIRKVKVNMNGVGALSPVEKPRKLIRIQSLTASSTAQPETVPYTLDERCQRTEYFVPEFAADASNGSRWMADSTDHAPWLVADLGSVQRVGSSRIAFVRPTAAHAYRLEGSLDGKTWVKCGGHTDPQMRSPHEDSIDRSFRYLRVSITQGIPGVWEWQVEEAPTQDFGTAEWISMDPDMTILFPHVHLLSEDSEQARSLKEYTLPVLTKTFKLRGEVRSARVDICGLGQYELTLDGNLIGDYFLSPGWTLYDKELLYNEFDVTDILQRVPRGELAVHVRLGGGMYDIPVKGYHKMAGSAGAPKLLFCLHVDYTDGTSEDLVSDASWMAEPSQVRYASIYAGEWDDASFSGTPRPVVVTRPHWDVPLNKQVPGTFVKVRQELPSKRIAPNLYDLGQNASGIVRIRVKGRKGQRIILRPSEVLKDGRIYQRSLPDYTWTYTLRGDRRGETWSPAFSYTGFRYVEVEADKGVQLLELTGLHTTTDAPEVGSFSCSDTLLNRIHALIDWAIRSNLVSITTDCPTREKLGWQEQNHLMAHSIMYRYDVRALMNKIADDLADSQHPDGSIPTTAPEYTPFEPGSGFEDTPEWGASFVLCPWYTYSWYGDDSAIRKHYPAMKRYLGYLASRAEGGILDYGLGDWFDIGPDRPGRAQLTSVALSATATYHYLLATMEQIARHLGRDGDAAYYANQAARVRQAFNDRFYTGGQTVYEKGSQAGLAMALFMGLVPEEHHDEALAALVRDITSRGYALTAGDVGFRYVVQALQQNGRSDVIFLMDHNPDIPGYAWQLKQGATALTESWQAYDDVSNNHLMLGHLMEWLYGGLGGIRPVAPGRLVIDPQMVGDVIWARTSLQTTGGPVRCNWTRSLSDGSWTVDAEIPQGYEAEVCLPDGRALSVRAGNHSFSSRQSPAFEEMK